MAEQQRRLALNEILGFVFEQRNISKKNILRLQELIEIQNSEFQEVRQLILDIALVHPGRRRRWKFIKQRHPDLTQRIINSQYFDWLRDSEYWHHDSDEFDDELDAPTLHDELEPVEDDDLLRWGMQNEDRL